ncbi:MAG: hypothetical protein AB7Q29_18010 [Vicinamibacterales bacterium]
MATTVAAWIHQRICGLQGHEDYVQFARGRMFLRCISCGCESPGWDVKARPAAANSIDAHARAAGLPMLGRERRAA